MANLEKSRGENPNQEIPKQETASELARAAFDLDGFELAVNGEKRPLEYIENALNDEIIGQSKAIESLITALYREDFRDPTRPITTLMFLGPTGVGKSHTAKALSRILHGNEDAITHINCSEISQDHRVSALLGAAPEYVGREQTPMLDRKKIEQPRSIVLFDEIEKSAPALRDLLLQITDEGQVTLLSDGKPVSFRNSIIILTSNLGSKEMQEILKPDGFGFNGNTDRRVDAKLLETTAINALTKSEVMRPEMLNRIDEKIVFQPLNDNQLVQVLDNYIERSNDAYHSRGFHMTVDETLLESIVASCDKGDDDRRIYAARPITRRYRKLVEGLVAQRVATGGIPRWSHIYTKFVDGGGNLADNIEVYHKRLNLENNSGLTLEQIEELMTTPATSGTGEVRQAVQREVVLDGKKVLGAAAVAGVAAMILGDMIGSRRRARRA